MGTLPRTTLRTTILAVSITLPGAAMAEGHFNGVWQPFSRPVEMFGAMTITADQLSYATGPQVQIEAVRAGGSIFRIISPEVEEFRVCGPDPANYVGFHVLDNGDLAHLLYVADTSPAEPTGGNSLEVVRNGACSVMFYVR
ncbi:hypothetical protein [Gymnodinialimonas ceratoperidinii]|uniref:Uncharacterized protein n=1 Tax=Gymnodinialimonas ceratoperidinii TaxID=2856823 RepID=A0A8F6TX00_9RHOB|nr:hypothetical protein [Gymnodinialimonas ceratoperidinii]QXT40482.1 hypothetical protein KYE46_04340 [Gymnodinialimonas ceratoperidinii]